MKEQTRLALIGLTLFLIVLVIIISVFSYFNNKYPWHCDIGKPDVAGDYTEHGWNQMWDEPVNQCAVMDCEAYNQAHNDSECMV